MSRPMREEADTHWMREALAQSLHAVGVSGPNPRVGCVIVSPDGRVLGRGFTQRAGEAHAEVRALLDARGRGERVDGATAYVTLEPCSHHGRTPPCCDALVAAGIARVVAAAEDPNPLVRGAGHARLRAAGIDVLCGLLADEAREINIGFFARMQRRRPWVRLKSAVSLDGRTALPNGKSQWITGDASRADGHVWRKRADAIVTGVGTVLADDPRLDVRLVPTTVQPIKVILDSQLRSPLSAQVFASTGRTVVYTSTRDPDRIAAFAQHGIAVQSLPGACGRVDLPAVLADLGARGVNEVHVEAGEALGGAFISQGLVDEFLIYMAPMLLGEGRSMAALRPLDRLALAPRLHLESVDRIGDDLRLIARPAPGDGEPF